MLNRIKVYIHTKCNCNSASTLSLYQKHRIYWWKQGHVMWEEHRNSVQTCRSRVRNVKALLDLNPVGDMTGNGKASAGTSVAKTKIWQMCSCLWTVQRTWWWRMWKRMRCPVSSLLWSLLARVAFSNSRSLKPAGKVWRKEELPSVKKDQIREHSNR